MAKAGDRIIIKKSNGKFDIFKVTESGGREQVRWTCFRSIRRGK